MKSEILSENTQSKFRYRFYREHKYVSYMLSELERLIAKTDFRNMPQVSEVLIQFDGIEALMKGHAQWEESAIHELLRRKKLEIQHGIEVDHRNHDVKFKEFRELLDAIMANVDEQEQLNLGYQFYIGYRKFIGDNLIHLHDEETIIMPELQKQYSDEELRNVEFNTYDKMNPEQMVQMMEVLFPHMNSHDREFFLTDIKDSQPDKFSEAWESISHKIDSDERSILIKKLQIY